MIYGYARVSTKGQKENYSFVQQKEEITARYDSTQMYYEQFTGATTHRPILSSVLEDLKQGDTLCVTKLDRLARTTTEGIELIKTLFDKGIAVHVLNIGWLENTPTGNFFITTLLAVAELERTQIIERTQIGKEIVKQNPNFKDGRPKKYREVQIRHAVELLKHHTYREVEEITGISKSTLVRAKRTFNS